MHSINKRIRELRKTMRLSQEKFGAILGISKSGVCDIEAGRRRVTETHILLLTSRGQNHVSEQWLRNGTGSMFRYPVNPRITLDHETDALQTDIFLKAMANAYLELDSHDRLVLINFLHRMDDEIRRAEAP